MGKYLNDYQIPDYCEEDVYKRQLNNRNDSEGCQSWFIVPVLKTGVRDERTRGSNPLSLIHI